MKIFGDILRGYQFQCLMEIKEIIRIGSQPSMHVWIRLQQLQTANLLQLRQYLFGEALKVIENLVHSGFACESAKEQLERNYD